MSNDEQKPINAGSLVAKFMVGGKTFDLPPTPRIVTFAAINLETFTFSLAELDIEFTSVLAHTTSFSATLFPVWRFDLTLDSGKLLPLDTIIDVRNERTLVMKLKVVGHNTERGVMECEVIWRL